MFVIISETTVLKNQIKRPLKAEKFRISEGYFGFLIKIINLELLSMRDINLTFKFKAKTIVLN